ncbi:MAG: ATP-binding protein [Spirochaetales bacterium]|nr:ATP-binding protein [Spirochaetales bacterium]
MINRRDIRKVRSLLPIDCHMVKPDRKGHWLIEKDFIRYLSLDNPYKPIGSVFSLFPLEEDRQWLRKISRKHFGTERRKLTLDPVLTGKKSIHCYFLGQPIGSFFLFRFNSDDRFHQTLRIPEEDRYKMFPLLYRGIVDDVKTPLHDIEENLLFLKDHVDKIPENEKLTGALDNSLDGTGKIATLAKALLEFQKGSENKKTTFSLKEVIESILILTKSNWKSNLDIHSFLPDSELTLFGDKYLIERAIFNLIVNGCQALEKGEKMGLLEIYAEEGPAGYRVIIKDNGPGFDEREQEKIFLPGYSTKDQGEGLGLPLVKQIVEEFHGGRITVESAPGKGSAFSLFLPFG